MRCDARVRLLPGLYTANTMACITEALGMSLPGTAATPAVDAGKLRLARDTGERAVGLVREGITPRQIVTLEAMKNAIRVDMALGGSTNTVLHLLAIATEVGVPLTLSDFDEIAETVPHLAAMQPGGPFSMERLYRAGGIPACLLPASAAPRRPPDGLGALSARDRRAGKGSG